MDEVARGKIGLLDTSILIDILDRGDIELYLNLSDKYDALYISVVTLYEYLYGLRILNKDIRKAKEAIESIFDIVYLDQESLFHIIDLEYSLRRDGIKIPDRDLVIAGIAKCKGYIVVTRDEKHFSKLKRYKVEADII